MLSTYLAKMMLFGACPLAILAGTWCLADYSNQPGQQGDVPIHCDAVELAQLLDLEEPASVAEPVLVLFYHPRCPCTQATVQILERLNTQFSAPPRTIAFAYFPSGQTDQWIETSTTEALEKLAGVRVIADRNGDACRRFGVTTSGHFLFYDRNSRLVFSGGITPFRGHQGECLASADLVRKVNGHGSDQDHWPVFGCEIVNIGGPRP